MRLQELKPQRGSKKKEKRVGRGEGSGHGKTSGKGHKGQKARSGTARKYGFEGGQNPLQRRLPKLPGFKSIFKEEYGEVNVKSLNIFDQGTEVNPQILKEKGLVRAGRKKVKILGDGELTKALTVKAHSFSRSAKEKIEKAGGKAEVI